MKIGVQPPSARPPRLPAIIMKTSNLSANLNIWRSEMVLTVSSDLLLVSETISTLLLSGGGLGSDSWI